MIAKKGSKPTLKVNDSHEGVQVYAAINARTRTVFVYYDKRLNSAAAKRFLYQFKKALGPGRTYLIWDGHGAHIAGNVRQRAKKYGIHFVPLPPYCPHLNPVEELFHGGSSKTSLPTSSSSAWTSCKEPSEHSLRSEITR